jgi:Arc/MetJ-type ribon-helix-helix transcriptional regulator
MDTITINISMPKGLYTQAKAEAKKYHYTSISELIRDSMRWWMNDNLTRNGFTPQFENMVLRREKQPLKNDIVWDGKGSFTDFVLREGKKKYDSIPRQRKLLQKSKGVVGSVSRIGGRDRTASVVV